MKYLKDMLIDNLQELADIELQRRRWLAPGGEVSSFEEAVEQALGDSGVLRGARAGDPDIPEAVRASVISLAAAAERVGFQRAPEDVIGDDRMRTVRRLAVETLSLVRTHWPEPA